MAHWKLNLVRAAVIVIAVFSIMLGIRQGDVADTLTKAITVCLECIGIG